MEVLADPVAGDTNHNKSVTLRKRGSLRILFDISILAALRTIRLNFQFGFRAEKVCNIFPNTFCLEKRTGQDCTRTVTSDA